MDDFLSDIWKEFQKNIQKTKVRTIGRATMKDVGKIKKEIKSSGEEEVEVAKSSITSATVSLKETVKGQFGNRVTELFDDQKKMLDEF